MDIFNKLLTNSGANALNENKGFEYSLQGINFGYNGNLDGHPFELTLGRRLFNAQSPSRGCILIVDVISDTYRVGRYQGEIFHEWKTWDPDYSTIYDGQSGVLRLIVKHKGYIWSYQENDNDDLLLMVTKKRTSKKI